MKMKMLAAAILFTSAAFAQAGQAKTELLSIQTIESGGVKVDLPTTRDDKGVVCVGYLKSASRKTDGTMDLNVGRYCGAGIEKTTASNGVWPQGLDAIQTVSENGVSSQTLVTHSVH